MFGDETETRSQPRVKICGITNATDALAAIDCGADALGFNFFPGSKRYIDISAAKDWMAELPRHVVKVAVLVNPTERQAVEVAQLSFIDVLQLHGEESPAFCRTIAKRGIAFVKALPVRDKDTLRDIPSFFTRTIMLDSGTGQDFGGTGETFSWVFARRFIDVHRELNVILAGGLTPENVAVAIRQVRPFAVDVASGVESAPGRKDGARLRAFINAARSSLS
jgi:phosphoribosylanthranilate isomerase